jgi:PAS domain S-box-containing protein
LKHTILDMLLQLCNQVIDAPELLPEVPTEAYPEESDERLVLGRFRAMLEHLQQSKKDALTSKEAQYRSIFESTTDALIVNDPQGFVVEANSAACQMLGYTHEELIGMNYAAFIPPALHPFVARYLRRILERHTIKTNTIGIRKDGSSFHADTHGTPFTYLGRPHVLSAVRDVTERIQAEEQLREKEAQYRGIFEATTDALFITDPDDGHLVEVNPAAYKMHGYTNEEFLQMHPTSFIHPDSHLLFSEYLQTVKAGGQFHAQAIDVRKDGTTFPVEVYGTQFTYQGKQHVLGIVRDITERIQAEEQLREKEAQYRAIFEASTDAVLIQDRGDGRVVEVNPAACKMHGYTYEEFIGLLPSAFIHPDSAQLVTETLQTLQAGGQYHALGLALQKDGTPFYADAYVTAFTYRGKPHLLSIVRDVSEQIDSETQLREKEEQYRSVFEASSDGLVINDLEDGHLVEVNPAMPSMHGYTYEEFMSLHPTQFIHLDSHPLFGEYLETVKAGRPFQARAVDIRKDGTPFPVEVHGTTFTYKSRPHGLAVVRDISEQVQAQQLLEQRVEDRTRELSTLLEVSHNVASTIELRPLLGLILDQLQEIVHYGGAAIATLHDGEFTFLDYLGPLAPERVAHMRLLFSQSLAHQQVLRSGEPAIIADVLEDTLLAQSLRETSRKYLGQAAADYMHSWMGIPLKSKERVIGLLSLSHNEPGYFTPQHARMALAIANQAAVAIENARLYEQAQDLAAIQERQRLARELHDSVSQALYGISLGAHTARTMLERDPGKVAEPLDYVLSLAEAGLAEMRALIFELRPETLATEGLVSALSKQVAAVQARHGIVVCTQFCEEPDVSLKVKQELYRVAQEALHNTVKHSQASTVELRLAFNAEGILLEVNDNGLGFNVSESFPGHLGLHSMRERVVLLGGKLQIESAPGQGTLVSAWIPAAEIIRTKTGTLSP